MGVFCLCISQLSFSQETADSILHRVDITRYADQVSQKAEKLTAQLDAKTEKVLADLQKQEEKIYRKLLSTKDSLAAKAKLQECREKYEGFRQKISSPLQKGSHYIPKLDSLNTSLKFLAGSGAADKVKDAIAKTDLLRDKFQVAEAVKKFIRERRQKLKEQLEKLGMVKQLKKINKQVYYYSQQIKEYKEILKDSRKIEKKALELLAKTKLFKDFMRKNSMLASLFRLPSDPGDPSTAASLTGLQTRAQVTALIQQQVGPNGMQQMRQNMRAAQSELTQLKNRIMAAGGGSSNDEMPDFKANNQKTKSFLKRLEYGANVQSQKASSFFPVTSDIGLSLGYKINDKSIIGIGASYKMGWGRGWNDIDISHQGIGLRSFIDIKLKGSFWISGGYEQNYKTAFQDFSELKEMSGWQQSGLIGLSKVIPLKTKFFKKTSVKLLWDFLSYRVVPRTQPVLVRIGYNF
jgi:hypothetical protein